MFKNNVLRKAFLLAFSCFFTLLNLKGQIVEKINLSQKSYFEQINSDTVKIYLSCYLNVKEIMPDYRKRIFRKFIKIIKNEKNISFLYWIDGYEEDTGFIYGRIWNSEQALEYKIKKRLIFSKQKRKIDEDNEEYAESHSLQTIQLVENWNIELLTERGVLDGLCYLASIANIKSLNQNIMEIKTVHFKEK